MGTLASMNMLDGFRLLGWCVGLVGLGLVVLRLVGPRVPRVRLRRKTPRVPRCPRCSYDLSGQADASVLTCPECGCDASGRRAFRRRVRTRWALLGLVMLMVAPSVGRVPLMGDRYSFVFSKERGWAALVPTTPLVLMQWFQPTRCYRAMTGGHAGDALLDDLALRCMFFDRWFGPFRELSGWHFAALAFIMNGRAEPDPFVAQASDGVRAIDITAIIIGMTPDYYPRAIQDEYCEWMIDCIESECATESWTSNGGDEACVESLGMHLLVDGPRWVSDAVEAFMTSIERADGIAVSISASFRREMVCFRIEPVHCEEDEELLNRFVYRIYDTLLDDFGVDCRVSVLGDRVLVRYDARDHDRVASSIARMRHAIEQGEFRSSDE